ncbi:hypothetical protein HYX70_04020 [Candidatus Saccharibacteria bacterium]|nr:hypothetical protein [Candidatus Saccharibacteria bacterium]
MKRNKKKKVWLIVFCLGALLLILLGLGYWQRQQVKNLASKIIPGLKRSDAPVQVDGKPQTEAKDLAGSQKAAEKASKPGVINPQITTIDQNATTVMVRAMVNNATTGTCTLKLQKTGQADITQTAPIARVTSYYACQGFNVPKSQIPINGEWTVTVLFANDQGNGQSGDIINVN